jgi:SAM-dependent methyltransferase
MVSEGVGYPDGSSGSFVMSGALATKKGFQLDAQEVTSDLARGRWPPRLARLIGQLACPACHSDIIEASDRFSCTACAESYPIRNGKIYFVEPADAEDALDMVKHRLKHHLGSLYYTVGVDIIAPGFPFNYTAAIRKHIDPGDRLVVDLGSGNRHVDDDIVTLDASDYGAVDIVARLEALPFKNGAIDALCSRSVLEHVPDLAGAVAEITRCTKEGGLSIQVVPFMYPFHASPNDFRRWSHVGAAELHRGWNVVEQRATTGPISLFLICLNEFVASLLSFGNPKLKAAIYLMMCLFTFPIKYLDALFVGQKSFIGLAPIILTVFRKP